METEEEREREKKKRKKMREERNDKGKEKSWSRAIALTHSLVGKNQALEERGKIAMSVQKLYV